MITDRDMCCKIICTTAEDERKAYTLISWMGSVAAKRLLKEQRLSIFIIKSKTKNMEHCAVVKCSWGVLFTIPRSILEPVAEPVYIHSEIDHDIVHPDKKYVRIISGTDQQRKKAFDLLSWTSDVTADRLIRESVLEVRKNKSGVPGLEHCCVVECSNHFLFPVPIEILERIDHG